MAHLSAGCCGAGSEGSGLAGYLNINISVDAVVGPEGLRRRRRGWRLVCLAEALKAGLSPELGAKVQLAYTVADAQKWSNFPPFGYGDRVGATLPQAYTNIIVGPQQDGAFPTLREGLRVGDLTSAQQALVLVAMQTYVGDINGGDAAVIMAKYEGELAETFIAYAGNVTMAEENDYMRIDGPSVRIESSIQPGRSAPGVHPHSVWRYRVTDYGGNA